LARIVDAMWLGVNGKARMVQGGIGAGAVEETMLLAAWIEIVPNDLVGVIDAKSRSVVRCSQWIIE
jgi:hypothetical protein